MADVRGRISDYNTFEKLFSVDVDSPMKIWVENGIRKVKSVVLFSYKPRLYLISRFTFNKAEKVSDLDRICAPRVMRLRDVFNSYVTGGLYFQGDKI